MADILGTDLALESSDLVVQDGDFALVTGVYCLKQDLLNAFLCPRFFWGMQIDVGSRLTEFIHGDASPLYLADLKRAVAEVFEAEPRVEKDSWDIVVEPRGGEIEITAEFLPIEWSTRQTIRFIVTDRGI